MHMLLCLFRLSFFRQKRIDTFNLNFVRLQYRIDEKTNNCSIIKFENVHTFSLRFYHKILSFKHKIQSTLAQHGSFTFGSYKISSIFMAIFFFRVSIGQWAMNTQKLNSENMIH